VDAPARQIADKAGVGVGTLYRHFPQRSDLIVAVFRNEVEACADAGPVLAAEYEPGDALDRWLQRYIDFIAAKRGLSAALRSGNPAFESLPIYFQEKLQPALRGLLEAAAKAGKVRADIDPAELLLAVARLCAPNDQGGINEQSRRMVALLVDGLRYQRRAEA
jgi:AcrR family transcriptional regulator